jgi:cell filamentation protein
MPTNDDAFVEKLVQGGADPYVEPSGVLRNLLGLTDVADIKAAEADAVSYRSVEAMMYLKAQNRFTFEAWKTLHHTLFQDLYDWAGQPRTINMGREGKIVFNTAAEIPAEAAAVLEQIEQSGNFAAEMGKFYGEMNFQHPFRDGNGRTLKMLFTAIAFRHGVFIDWGRLDPDRYTEALNHWQRTQEPCKIEAVLTACSRPATIDDTLQ